MSNTSPIATDIQKPLEIYMFVDPLCPECWSLEPAIKIKNQIRTFFTLRIIVSASITSLNKQKRKNTFLPKLGKNCEPFRDAL